MRPEYVDKKTAKEGAEPWVATPDIIERVRRQQDRRECAGYRRCRRRPGVTTDELDGIVHDYLIAHDSIRRRWATRASRSRAARRSTR